MAVFIDVVLAVAAVGGTIIAFLQYRSKKAEGARADKAESARERTAIELASVKEELAGSRDAQEQLAAVGWESAENERRAARDSLRQQKKQSSSTEKAARDALSEQKRQARKRDRERRAQDKKVLAESKKQTRASEKLAKEARRKK